MTPEEEEKRADQLFLAMDQIERYAKQYAWLTHQGASPDAVKIWDSKQDFIQFFCDAWGHAGRETLDGLFRRETTTALRALDLAPKVQIATGSNDLVIFDHDSDCGCTPPCGHGVYRVPRSRVSEEQEVNREGVLGSA